jgi:hypothetical protein
MILERLTLRNFGLFCGEQIFNLAPAQRNGRGRQATLEHEGTEGTEKLRGL